MKKRTLIVGSFVLLHFFGKAQVINDSNEVKVNKTAIELVYNHYLQDGNNSAITGGIGTEKLTVYGPSLNIKKTKNNNSFSLNVGADIISSASTDKIDSIVSSASAKDARAFINGGYEHYYEKNKLSLSGGLGASIESDYFSLNGKLGLHKMDKKKIQTYSLLLQVFNDDLRWGRLNPGYYRPVKLIYPSELRDKEWHDNNKRYSYNLKAGYTKIINKRTILGFFPEFTYQTGLLSTPFHRVYFSDGSLAVENLPNKRLKGALALKLNTFVKGSFVLKNTINSYVDDFGIIGIAIEHETAIKMNHAVTLLPNFRIYTQQAADYFNGFQEHNINDQYYSSDYDLSQFETYNLGIGIRYTPLKHLTKKVLFNNVVLRYSYLKRSNNLSAHSISLVFLTESIKPQQINIK